MREKNFTLTVENSDSPIIITVPHGGIKGKQGSWLELFFKRRTKSEEEEENFIDGEKIVLGGDSQIMHIVADILKDYEANAIIGLLPRLFVDYNRFNPRVAYADKKIKPFYDEYHKSVNRIIGKILSKHKNAVLFDFHGFGHQPIENIEFDIVLGTNKQSSPRGIDKFLYSYMKNQYEVFCAGTGGFEEEGDSYKGDTTNFYYYKRYGIDAILVEIAPKFRSLKQADSKTDGEILAKNFAEFFKVLHNQESL